MVIMSWACSTNWRKRRSALHGLRACTTTSVMGRAVSTRWANSPRWSRMGVMMTRNRPPRLLVGLDGDVLEGPPAAGHLPEVADTRPVPGVVPSAEGVQVTSFPAQVPEVQPGQLLQAGVDVLEAELPVHHDHRVGQGIEHLLLEVALGLQPALQGVAADEFAGQPPAQAVQLPEDLGREVIQDADAGRGRPAQLPKEIIVAHQFDEHLQAGDRQGILETGEGGNPQFAGVGHAGGRLPGVHHSRQVQPEPSQPLLRASRKTARQPLPPPTMTVLSPSVAISPPSLPRRPGRVRARS